jgi:hypothetical protein
MISYKFALLDLHKRLQSHVLCCHGRPRWRTTIHSKRHVFITHLVAHACLHKKCSRTLVNATNRQALVRSICGTSMDWVRISNRYDRDNLAMWTQVSVAWLYLNMNGIHIVLQLWLRNLIATVRLLKIGTTHRSYWYQFHMNWEYYSINHDRGSMGIWT